MGSSKDKYKPDKPVFIGNFDYEATEDEIRDLVGRYGDIGHIDMKTGFAFCYMKDVRDGEDAIRDLEGQVWGRKGRRLKMDWARGDGEVKRREDTRRKKTEPSKTLFVVNFDVVRTRERDLEDLFGKFGRLTRVQIKKNFAFVQFEDLADSEAALKETHLSHFTGRTISVEFVAREADGRRADDPPPLPYERRRRSYSRSRSCSPRRERSRSPHGNRSRSPYRSRSRRSRSPVPRRRASRSPVPRRSRSRRSPTPSYSRSLSRSVSRSRSPRRARSPRRSPRGARSLTRSPTRSPRRSVSRSPRRSYSR